jgi:hypothetical protein
VGKHAELFNIKAGGMYNNHSALKGLTYLVQQGM